MVLITGAYSLVEPDGSLRVVEYWADDKSGFNAVVKRLGPNLHPVSAPASIYKAAIPVLGHASAIAPISVGPVAKLGHLGTAPLISGPIVAGPISTANLVKTSVPIAPIAPIAPIIKTPIAPIYKTPIAPIAPIAPISHIAPIAKPIAPIVPSYAGAGLTGLGLAGAGLGLGGGYGGAGSYVGLPGPIYKSGPIYPVPLPAPILKSGPLLSGYSGHLPLAPAPLPALKAPLNLGLGYGGYGIGDTGYIKAPLTGAGYLNDLGHGLLNNAWQGSLGSLDWSLGKH